MTARRLLLLSNSKNYQEQYLGHAGAAIKAFLGAQIKELLFIPYAGVRLTYDEYAAKVGERFQEFGYQISSIDKAGNAQDAVKSAPAMVVGGGNTFQLLRSLYQHDLIDAMRARVAEGMPYIGWSAGANIACPTIKTTNDMPIVEPPSFNALNLVPFQINPHFTEEHPVGHQGETRADRIAEFNELNPNIYVVGLREGSMLRIEADSIKLLGDKDARIFIQGREAANYAPADALQFLLEKS
jgi:dipeptidase E